MLRMEYQPLLRGSSTRSKVSRTVLASEDGPRREFVVLTMMDKGEIL